MARLADLVEFKRDLLFSGAVQIGWLESDDRMAAKAASHFLFHGPSYHGVDQEAIGDVELRAVDTATFTLDLVERVTGKTADEPFSLAVAGYGTGKSHLALTLAYLLRDPKSDLAQRILDNLSSADSGIAAQVRQMLDACGQPFLTVALNGMRNFDLAGEVVRQVLDALRQKGIDTSLLENLRPRFRYATNFAESFYGALESEFREAFVDLDLEQIIQLLHQQDESAFKKVNELYERKMGASISAAGRESLDDFVRITRESYCGKGKPFAGMVILFDEFGRYLEFSVQMPHVAGPGALQQLFESVQVNAEGVFLLAFIQYELKAYVARVAPELRDDLQRYVTRYDVVPKARLSTNLETLIANLLHKSNAEAANRHVQAQRQAETALQSDLKRWFPEMEAHAIWANRETFERVVREGCWPLHPLSTWLLYRLASVGRSLQQRSALALLADAYSAMEGVGLDGDGFAIAPVDVCGEALIDEFAASERFGQQGASAHAYRELLSKYEHQLENEELRALKAVLLAAKTSPRAPSKDEALRILSLFSGCSLQQTRRVIGTLESERGALAWNEGMRRYEIVSEAVPRSEFVAYLRDRVAGIASSQRGGIFSQNYARWFPELEVEPTTFGEEHQITTKEWGFRISFANVELLPNQIDLAFRNWLVATNVDEPKGQLIYCYVAPESDLQAVEKIARDKLRSLVEQAGQEWEIGTPIAVQLLHDVDGTFGRSVAEFQVLEQGLQPADKQRYGNFILERRSGLESELRNLFQGLQLGHHFVFGTGASVPIARTAVTLAHLFEAVYPRAMPFPFDGFTTARGNAAKDCGLFTRELFLGHLDGDWIGTRPSHQKSRAVQVLSTAWEGLDDVGGLRQIPGNPSVRPIMEDLDSRLMREREPEPLNLGKALRRLCAPPFGCNLASAGLLLALYVGARKEAVQLYKDEQSISTDVWLQSALSGSFLDLSVVDRTDLVRVSREAVDEWTRLLNLWEIEKTHSGKVSMRQKARELEARVPVPHELHYRYKNLITEASRSLGCLTDCNAELDRASEKIIGGEQAEDVSVISWGAAMMTQQRERMELEEGTWTEEHLAQVEKFEAQGRLLVQRLFDGWLRKQRPTSFALAGEFFRKIKRVGDNLEILGLAKEKAKLEQHASEIEAFIGRIDKIRSLTDEIQTFVHTNRIGPSTPIGTLSAWREQAARYKEPLRSLGARLPKQLQDALAKSSGLLDSLELDCLRQIELYEERARKVYNSKPASLGEIRQLVTEVTLLCHLFQGREDDVADFRMVLQQLAMVENHWGVLGRGGMGADEVASLVEAYAQETEDAFGEDEPPLDNEVLYKAMEASIRETRHQTASRWMDTNVPSSQEIEKADASRTQQIKKQLEAAPPELDCQQRSVVRDLIGACDHRLDDLEVNGMVARFEALSQTGKRLFLAKIGVG